MTNTVKTSDLTIYANGVIGFNNQTIKNARINNLGRGYRLFINGVDVMNVDDIYHTKKLTGAILPHIQKIISQ
jgi:hypothetical protein